MAADGWGADHSQLLSTIRRLIRCYPHVVGLVERLCVSFLFRLDPMINTQAIREGDVCLYKPTGLFGKLIVFHTGGPCSHAEIYAGHGFSLASRDGLGTGRYPFRTADLGWVLRPTVPFDIEQMLDWFEATPHQPYGWYDLLQFCGYPVNGTGVVCSPFVVYALRAGTVRVFKDIPPERIAPNDLLLSELLLDVTSEVLIPDASDPVPAHRPVHLGVPQTA